MNDTLTDIKTTYYIELTTPNMERRYLCRGDYYSGKLWVLDRSLAMRFEDYKSAYDKLLEISPTIIRNCGEFDLVIRKYITKTVISVVDTVLVGSLQYCKLEDEE